ncbi:2-dehydro-3-deoxy-6-phosphogalactonate aldolase [Ferrovibrio sp.]|uniref:2-dehydro-3-deoxy-6-phosphogalactonate aldolase n=1 Tax=Ferrovibrio sp. TaxID=1917215 RepID=UPI0026386D44|nr:2-dehydro-3-deoxy-6-phosphogalactonate aldolase [Ferrovibrio sp.]
MKSFSAWLQDCPVIAILRGIRTEEAVEIGAALYEAGFRIIEVPLNSPDPMESIAALSKHFGDRALIGAGTVIDPGCIKRVAMSGGHLIVAPNANPYVVHKAKILDMAAVPGVFTPTEAFAMIAEGADALKLFPAEAASPVVLKSLRAVLPPRLPVLPVGGIHPEDFASWQAAGAAGFGLGSALYKPGFSARKVAKRAKRVMAALSEFQRNFVAMSVEEARPTLS